MKSPKFQLGHTIGDVSEQFQTARLYNLDWNTLKRRPEKETMKKIYIAGKVTGESRLECAAKFQEAATHLESKGFQAVNPLQVVGTWETTWEAAMKKCIAALTEVDAVFLLPCHVNSPGALFEIEVANKLQIPVFAMVDELVQFVIA